MSSEEQRRLKEDLSSLGMDDISSFMEALPQDFYVILRTDGLLRSILGNLGAPRHVRLLTYAKCAIHGLEKQPKLESGTINRMFLQVKTNISYLHLRVLIGKDTIIVQMSRLCIAFSNPACYLNFLRNSRIVSKSK
jgi:aarF domain-containing kinase